MSNIWTILTPIISSLIISGIVWIIGYFSNIRKNSNKVETLEKRVDKLESDLKEEKEQSKDNYNKLDARIDEKFDKIMCTLTDFNKKFDDLNTDFNTRMVKVETKLDYLASEVSETKRDISEIKKEIKEF